MRKNIIIFLAIISGFIIFKADFCLALNNPENPSVSDIGEAKATLKWSWSENGGTIKQFKVLYKEEGALVWTTRYPMAGNGNIEYKLMGLFENTTYHWRIKAEAQNPANDSNFVDGPDFATIQAQAPPPPPEENGGVLKFFTSLENPLGQDNFWDAMNAASNFLVLAAFIIAPILIIYSAFLMIFATGDAAKINKAKSIITWTLVALALTLSAKMLPGIIKEIFIN